MTGEDVCLGALFDPAAPGIISLTGGGGKTSLLFALAERLVRAGQPVACTTTTRMLQPAESEWLRVEPADALRATPRPGRAVFAARPPGADGKAHGYPPEAVDAAHARLPECWILVEADGAAGKPIKAPAAHEPVVPTRTGTVIAVIGLGCMGRPLVAEHAFRPEAIAAVAGLRPGEAITPRAAARLALHPLGLFKGAPPSSRRILFCNQSDLPGAEAVGREVAREIRLLRPQFLAGTHVGSVQRKGLRCLFYPAG